MMQAVSDLGYICKAPKSFDEADAIGVMHYAAINDEVMGKQV